MNLKKYAPHLLAVILFAAITIIHFRPMFQGKVINQSDIVQHRGMSKELVDYRNSGQGEALWTNSMFGGMPAYQVSTTYPGNWLGFIDRLFHLFLPHPSGYIFGCFLGFFILLLCLRIDPWLAMAGALAFGFSSYFFIILDVGHNSKANAISYLAPVLGGLMLLLQGRYRLGFAVSALFMALELNANHVQITYYGFMIFALICLTYFVIALQQKTLKPFFIAIALFAVACGVGVLPNAGNLLATSEYSAYTTRGKTELTIGPDGQSNKDNVTSGLDKKYALQYSHGIYETFTTLIPNFKGGGSSRIADTDKDALKAVDPQMREQIAGSDAYFGDQGGTSGPVYLGAIVMFLAFLGLFIIDHPLRWPLFVATVLGVMLSWGRFFPGLSYFFLDHVPGYNKFRAVSMTLVIAEFCVPLLTVLAIDRLLKLQAAGQAARVRVLNKDVELRKLFLGAAIVVGGFCLLGAVMPTMVNSFSPEGEQEIIAQQYLQSGASKEQIDQVMPSYMENLQKARMAIFQSDAWRSFLFITLAALLVYAFLIGKLKRQFLLLGLGILFIADLWPVAFRYLNGHSFVSRTQFEAPPRKSAADEQILADASPDFRVLNLTVSPFQDATTSHYHKSIGGYHGAKLKKYDELISFHLMDEIYRLNTNFSRVNSDSMMNALLKEVPVLNMLNTRYFILPGRESDFAVRNPQANGNAWFVQQVRTVASADSEIVSLNRIDNKTTALVQQKNNTGLSATYANTGTIALQSYKPNHLVYEAQSDAKGFAVFSEIYYPKGWNAYIDGTLTPYTCVDYLLRGMEIPAGKHRVEFRFEPGIYKTANTLSLAGSVILLVVVGASGFLAFRKKEVAI